MAELDYMYTQGIANLENIQYFGLKNAIKVLNKKLKEMND